MTAAVAAFLLAAILAVSGASSNETDWLSQSWTKMQTASLYATWKKQNKGEASKLEDYWSNGGTAPALATAFGQALVLEAQAYWSLEAPPPPPAVAACANGVDDDGDSKIDLADPGCVDSADTDETDPAPPPSSGYPDATNTGVPAGTTLTTYAGPSTVTTANMVIDGKNIGCITVSAPGVVIKNSRISCNAFIVFRGGGTSSAPLVVQDTDIDCQGSNGTGVDVTNATFLRVDVFGCENGFNVGGPITVQDSYIHDLVTANGAHTDGMQFNQGASNITVRHNTINPTSASSGATSCIIMWDESAPQNANVLIENNRLLGRGTAATIYTPRQGPLTNVRVINNRMIPGQTYNLYNGGNGTLLTDGSGNVNDATGQPVSLD